MNDITPRKRPLSPNTPKPPSPRLSAPRPQPASVASSPNPTPQPAPLLVEAPPSPLLLPKGKSPKKRIIWILLTLLTLIVIACAGAFAWYKLSLRAVNASDTSRTRVDIVSGSSPATIAQLLESKKLIRSTLAFDIYTRLSGTRTKLQAGTYSLSPSESTEAIVDHLVKGKVDQFNITFLPGATLAEDRAQLLNAGYAASDVDAALQKTYASPLFADKPATADLEGYVYGDTYNFDSSATPEQILTRVFDEYYQVVQKNNLITDFQAQGLNLYQGITLASIIQREVSNPSDQKQVAQVFLKRLSSGMPLGSDVTYQYAAKKLGVTPSPDLDSPYNTRKYAGLPPGPIATPGLSALQAVAHPASGDYLYFLSGDDGITYFATTEQQHEQNIQDHCKIKCAVN